MRTTSWILVSALVAAPAAAARNELALDPAATEVSFDLGATGHDVHGVVALETGAIHFDTETGDAGGEIVLDATGAATGNKSRDRTMRDDVLETAKFPRIVFRPARIEGNLPSAGKGSITLRGTIALHGAEHPIALPAEVTVSGNRIDATAKATIPYQDWGLADPSVLFLRVARVVAVSIHTRGEFQSTPAVAERTGSR